MWTRVDGLRMHARVAKGGAHTGYPTVVLVHGLVVSSRYMVPIAEQLAPYCCAYAPDLPGFGKSDRPGHVLDIAEMADALAAWMGAAALDRAMLLGNSIGCQVIVDFALRYPERIERAVLAGPTMDPRGRPFPKLAARWLLDLTRESLSFRAVMAPDYLAAGPRRAVCTLRYALQDRIEEKLPAVRVPTLVVRGNRDPIVPQRWAAEVAQLLPAGKLVVIPGAAHTVNYTAPEALARVVRPFLDEMRTTKEESG
jgi:2-hydroxy-6-oxonona-2,4-dienedioate hydrolase